MYVRVLRYDFSSISLIGYAAKRMSEIEAILECYELSYTIENRIRRDEDGDTAYVRELYIDDGDITEDVKDQIRQKCDEFNKESKLWFSICNKSFNAEMHEIYDSEMTIVESFWDESYDDYDNDDDNDNDYYEHYYDHYDDED